MKTYTTPIFKPIKLNLINGGTAGGCAMISNSTENMCKVYDMELGDELFNDDVGCREEVDYKLCYYVPTEDRNVYAS